jgi:tetratricopeptide (TPR) repeat protein
MKEKTGRYEFVNQLLPDLLKKDKKQIILTTNLIYLILEPSEAEQLFNGFANSDEEELQHAGKTGLETIKKEISKKTTALSHERRGFEALSEGNFEKAITEFDKAEETYPTLHQNYEISQLLREEKDNIRDKADRKRVIKKIIDDYSWKVPDEQLEILKQAAE